MNSSTLDIDFLYMAGYIFAATTFDNLNPYVVFFGGLITIIVGITNIIKFYYWIKDRKTQES